MNKQIIVNLIGIAMLVAAVVVIGFKFAPFLDEQFAIEECQKAGGSWDFNEARCEGKKP